MSQERSLSKVSRWVVMPVALLAMMVLVQFLNRPGMERLETVSRELSRAGHPDARVTKTQRPRNLVRCGVSQVRKNRGYAYDWETDSEAGVFCLPTDGRPAQILLN